MSKHLSEILLKNLRACFKNKVLIKDEISAYIVPHDDAHNNEYINENDNRLRYISNFSGSWGTAIITEDKAALWTDGRYHLQAADELDLTNWILMKDGLENVPKMDQWLIEVLKPKSKVGIDPSLMANLAWKGLEKMLKKNKLSLVPILPNLIDEIWENKEPRPQNVVYPLDMIYSGQSWQSKVNTVISHMAGQAELKEIICFQQSLPLVTGPDTYVKFKTKNATKREKAGSLLLTALDEIAWLLNLRGSDIPYNPVFFAYLIINRYPIKFKARSRFSNSQNQLAEPPVGPEIVLFYGSSGELGLMANRQDPKTFALLKHLEIVNENEHAPAQNGIKEPENLSSEGIEENPNVLFSSQVRILPYDSIYDYLNDIDWIAMGEDYKIWISPSANYALYSLVPGSSENAKEDQNNNEKATITNHLYNEPSPVLTLKAIKNSTELEGTKIAHVLDAITLCDYFSWLSSQVLENKGAPVTEVQAAEKLLQMRTEFFEQPSSPSEIAGRHLAPGQFKECFKGLSFATISSSGPHSAVIHYHPQPSTDRPIIPGEIYLCDSGSQYLYGTTDVTRTFYFGSRERPDPQPHMKRNYTLVLKGHLALSRAIFPIGSKGYRLDAFARQYLWDHGLEYLHGTGHGVGSFLNVHEGPECLGSRASAYDNQPCSLGIQENSLLTIEPGFYLPDQYGIRIENTCYVVKAPLKETFNNVIYLTFKPLTLVPYQLNLIDLSLLTQQEIDQINAYHILCREHVGKELERLNMGRALTWFRNQTLPLSLLLAEKFLDIGPLYKLGDNIKQHYARVIKDKIKRDFIHICHCKDF